VLRGTDAPDTVHHVCMEPVCTRVGREISKHWVIESDNIISI